MKTRFIFIAGALAASLALAETPALLEPDLFDKAPVVLRVKWIRDLEAGKYAWQECEVSEVLKNVSKRTFSNTVEIAHYSWTNGIPHTRCTVYLEKYDPLRDDLWKLLGGSSVSGVSHIEEQTTANNTSESIVTKRPGSFAAEPPSIAHIENSYSNQIAALNTFCRLVATYSIGDEYVQSNRPHSAVLEAPGLLRVSLFSRKENGVSRGFDLFKKVSVKTRLPTSRISKNDSGARAYSVLVELEGEQSWRSCVYYECVVTTNHSGRLVGFELLLQDGDEPTRTKLGAP